MRLVERGPLRLQPVKNLKTELSCGVVALRIQTDLL